jgi:GNAT superfamily N-acetyltransferase
MSEILQDFSEPALVHAIEANLFELFPLFRKSPRMEVHDDPNTLWSITNIPIPLYNSVFRAQISPDNVDAVIELAIMRGKLRNVPLMWWTGPATRPSDLGMHLERHDFNRHDDITGMAVELKKLNEGQIAPPGLIIEQVRDSAALKQWCHVVTVGFGFPEPVSQDIFDLSASLGFGDELAIRHYLGWLEGEPVASSSLLLGAGVAGIYDVATLPDVRRKGIGAATTLRPLVEARAMGYRVGILQASQMGVSVYSKLGFQEYCKIGIYIWEGEQEDHATG